MSNQTPHTPLSPSPSLEMVGGGSEGELTQKTSSKVGDILGNLSDSELGGGIQKMRPITIPPEMKDLVKKINELATTVIPELEKSEEENRKRELEKQNEFIEINGIKLETENLGKPTHPDIQILEEGDEEIDLIPYCWNNGDDWYYNWYAAILEAKYLGKRLPTQKEFNKIFSLDKEGIIELTEQEFKILMEELNLKTVDYQGEKQTFLWSSTINSLSFASCIHFDGYNFLICRHNHKKYNSNLSVRCIFSEEEETEEERKKREERKFIELLEKNEIPYY